MPLPTPTDTANPPHTPIPTSTPDLPVITLLTTHNKYVTAGNGEDIWNWAVKAKATTISYWEKFWVSCLDDGRFALLTHHGNYVTAMDDGIKLDGSGKWDWELRNETHMLDRFEMFTFFDPHTKPEEKEVKCEEVIESLSLGNIEIALKTYHGRYVTAMDNGMKISGSGNWDWELRAETFDLQASEIFTATLLSP
jgi:hypothetical protein